MSFSPNEFSGVWEAILLVLVYLSTLNTFSVISVSNRTGSVEVNGDFYIKPKIWCQMDFEFYPLDIQVRVEITSKMNFIDNRLPN